jgi:hypothetical protein
LASPLLDIEPQSFITAKELELMFHRAPTNARQTRYLDLYISATGE